MSVRSGESGKDYAVQRTITKKNNLNHFGFEFFVFDIFYYPWCYNLINWRDKAFVIAPILIPACDWLLLLYVTS